LRFLYQGSQVDTPVVREELSPAWPGFEAEFAVGDVASNLVVQLWDDDQLQAAGDDEDDDDFLGCCVVPIATLPLGSRDSKLTLTLQPHPQLSALYGPRDKKKLLPTTGEVTLHVTFTLNAGGRPKFLSNVAAGPAPSLASTEHWPKPLAGANLALARLAAVRRLPNTSVANSLHNLCC